LVRRPPGCSLFGTLFAFRQLARSAGEHPARLGSELPHANIFYWMTPVIASGHL